MRSKMQGGFAWLAMAMQVSTRLWLGATLSTHRNLTLIEALIQRVRTCTLCRPLLFATDGLQAYVHAIRAEDANLYVMPPAVIRYGRLAGVCSCNPSRLSRTGTDWTTGSSAVTTVGWHLYRSGGQTVRHRLPVHSTLTTDSTKRRPLRARVGLLPDIRDEAIFHLCHILVISGQFCSQRVFLLHRSKCDPDDEDQPHEYPNP